MSAGRFPSERALLPADQQAAYDAIGSLRGTVPAPYLPLLASPQVAQAFERFSAVLWAGTLPADVQEAIFLSTAQAWHCAHQWRSHEPKALAAGVPAAAIDSLRAGRIPGETEAGPRLAAVLRFADSLHRQRRVPQEVFDAVAGQLDAAQLSELVGFCALAVSVALLLNVRDA